MKITAQEEYGLRCLMRLARAEAQSGTIPEIAAGEGLSAAYVGKLLAVLRQAGVIESVRGRTGGYRLAKSTREVGLGTLLLILGEPLFEDPEYCQKHAGVAEEGCVHQGACSLRALWFTLEQWIRSSLDQITLADLLQSEGQIAELVRSRLAHTVFPEAAARIALLTT